MNSIIDNMEAVLVEAHKVKGWRFVHEHPLWVTWTLEKFGTVNIVHHRDKPDLSWCKVTSVASLLVPYHRSLQMHIDLVNALRSHSMSFEDSRIVLAKWVSQAHLEGASWDAKFEDICGVEVDRWDR